MPSLRSSWKNPWVRRPLKLALAFTLTLGGCWLYLDYSGRAAWREAQRQLAAEGETIDFRALLPPAAAEAENFCAIAPLRNLAIPRDDSTLAGAEGKKNGERLKDLQLRGKDVRLVEPGGVTKGIPMDVANLAKAMRLDGNWGLPPIPGDLSKELTAAFARWDGLFDELSASLARPKAQWTPNLVERPWPRPYLNGSAPALSEIFELTKALKLRAQVASRLGDWPRALACFRCQHRLLTAQYEEPVLLGLMLGVAMQCFTADILWEFSRSQQGTSVEWEEMEKLCASFAPRATALRNARSNLAAQVDYLMFVRDTSRAEIRQVLQIQFGLPENADWLIELLPKGAFDAAAADVTTKYLQYYIRPLRDGGWKALLRGQADWRQEQNFEGGFRWNLPRLTGEFLLSFYDSTIGLSVYQQTLVNQSIIACAVERWRLAQGSYPASLEGVTLNDDRALPSDPVTGQPMHYERTENGRYRLWSIALDGMDDHGRRGSGNDTTSADYRGDWVWDFQPEP